MYTSVIHGILYGNNSNIVTATVAWNMFHKYILDHIVNCQVQCSPILLISMDSDVRGMNFTLPCFISFAENHRLLNLSSYGSNLPVNYILNLLTSIILHGCPCVGAKVDLADTENWTPLMVASRDGNLDIVKVLLENGK